MASIARITLFTAAALALSAAAFGQAAPPAADLSGRWIVESQQTLSSPVDAVVGMPAPQNGGQMCTYAGSASVDQQADGALSGGATLNLVTGSPPCPNQMAAQLTGDVDGTQVTMGMLMGGQLGTATFDGTINLPAVRSPGGEPAADRAVGSVAAPQLAGVSVAGTSAVTQGNFLGATGTFNAVPQLSVVEIPTLTQAGLVLLVVLLLGSATFLLLRRRRIA